MAVADHHLACGGEREPIAVERERRRVHVPEAQGLPLRRFGVWEEAVHVFASHMNEERDHRHAWARFEPLAQVVGLLSLDADAGFAERLVDDGLLGGFAVVHVSAGEAPATNGRWNTALHDVRVAELVQQDGVRDGRRLDPPRVRRVWVAAGELIPVVLPLLPAAERVLALVAPKRDETGVDGGAAVAVGEDGTGRVMGHGVLLGA